MPSPYNRKTTKRKEVNSQDGSITVKAGSASHRRPKIHVSSREFRFAKSGYCQSESSISSGKELMNNALKTD